MHVWKFKSKVELYLTLNTKLPDTHTITNHYIKKYKNYRPINYHICLNCIT